MNMWQEAATYTHTLWDGSYVHLHLWWLITSKWHFPRVLPSKELKVVTGGGGGALNNPMRQTRLIDTVLDVRETALGALHGTKSLKANNRPTCCERLWA